MLQVGEPFGPAAEAHLRVGRGGAQQIGTARGDLEPGLILGQRRDRVALGDMFQAAAREAGIGRFGRQRTGPLHRSRPAASASFDCEPPCRKASSCARPSSAQAAAKPVSSVTARSNSANAPRNAFGRVLAGPSSLPRRYAV